MIDWFDGEREQWTMEKSNIFKYIWAEECSSKTTLIFWYRNEDLWDAFGSVRLGRFCQLCQFYPNTIVSVIQTAAGLSVSAPLLWLVHPLTSKRKLLCSAPTTVRLQHFTTFLLGLIQKSFSFFYFWCLDICQLVSATQWWLPSIYT